MQRSSIILAILSFLFLAASLWAQVWQAWSAVWTGGWIKEGPGMDPNGGTPHQPILHPPMRGDHPDQVRVRR